jgi:K+-transporting ATPase KdpF subunit
MFLMVAGVPGGASREMFLNDPAAYTAGIIVAVLLLIYLVYALLKPEKF